MLPDPNEVMQKLALTFGLTLLRPVHGVVQFIAFVQGVDRRPEVLQ